MTPTEFISISIQNYKCFGSEGGSFDSMSPINLVIGRNNSGKSSLLDLIEYLTHPTDIAAYSHKGAPPQVVITTRLTEPILRNYFSDSRSGGSIPGNHWDFARDWIGKSITWALDKSGAGQFIQVDPHPHDNHGLEYFKGAASTLPSPLKGRIFRRLRSDRDISPEADVHVVEVSQNGQGVTTLIRHFLTKASLPSSIVEETLLRELNKVFEPDTDFQDITARQLDDSSWEIYLGEGTKGRVPLSRSGSGLKTVLLVLTLIHLIPVMEHKDLDAYIFGFEELENNLHPALLRRLFIYLRNIAGTAGCQMFVTTHSNVVIDLFGDDEKAQIIHVQHDGTTASTTKALAYVQRRGILDDLDIRASDLLQSNGIVWVEGPSDRLYFKKWVELWSTARLKEGAHFQCVFYGGRLLAHLTAEDPEVEIDDLVRILRVNRNAIILIDSDRPKKGAHINATKRRLASEVETLQGYAWITAGREVENYIPPNSLQAALALSDLPKLDQYREFDRILDGLSQGEGKKFLSNKVRFAAQLCPILTREALAGWLDLSSQLQEVTARIARWNGLSLQ